MALPGRLTIHDSAYALDGGTTFLDATDETGRKHSVALIQHAFPQPDPSLDEVPGRLYFDDELVPMRSELETQVLALLRKADVRFSDSHADEGESTRISPNALILGDEIRQVLSRGPEDNIRALSSAVVAFVESEEYLQFAERVEQAADTTRYIVWAACEPSARNQVAVRMGRVLGIGLQAAQQLLASGAPLAADKTALEVAEMARRYATEGLPLRVQPAFRWRLT